MKKILVILLLISVFAGSAFSAYYFDIFSKIDPETEPSSTGSAVENPLENTISNEPAEENEPLSKDEIVRKKIETIKRRLALKGLIIEGDSYYRGGQLPLALKKYLEFYKQNPTDTLINEKLGDTYFQMHKYGSALNYYGKISELTEEQKLKIVMSSIYSTDITQQEKLSKLENKIRSLELAPQQEYYFLTSLSCSGNFHECKKSFGNYFWPEQEVEIVDISEENTDSTQEETLEVEETQEIENEVTFADLKDIQHAIQNYRNFQLDDVYLKDAYIIGAFYSNKMYTLAINLGEKLLQERTDYKPILKIVAQSYFELGEYEKARDAFGNYYEIDKSDAAVAYSLGIINSKLREYVLANINFNKALELGYTKTADIYRQLTYSYYLLENDESMLSSFKKLIELDDYTQVDLQLAIYYHIIHEDYDTALSWARLGKDTFIDTANFHAYEGWILREQGDVETAKQVLEAGGEREENNPFVLINLAYTHLEQDNLGAGVVLFKKIIQTSPKSEFATQAQTELDAIENNEDNS